MLSQNKQIVLRVTLQSWCADLMTRVIGKTPIIFHGGVILIERIQKIHCKDYLYKPGRKPKFLVKAVMT